MKLFRLLYLIFLLFIPASSHASQGADSLKFLLDSASGKERIPLLIQIMEMVQYESPRAALGYGKEAMQLIRKYPDKKSETEIYFRTGWIYSQLNNSDSAKYFAELMGKTAASAGFLKGEVMKLLLHARISRTDGQNQEALKYLDTADMKNKSLRDILLNVKIINEKGSVLRRLSRYDEAFALHKQALDLLKDIRDDEELRVTYTYLGIISDLKVRYDDALKYHHEALKISNRLSDKRGTAASLVNIGILYLKIDKYDEALKYYKRGLEVWKELNNIDHMASTLNNIGAVYEHTRVYYEALNYYKQALKIWEQSGKKNSIVIGLLNVGNIYSELGNYKEASDYLKRSNILYTELGDKQGMANSLINLGSLYNKLGKTDDAVASVSEGIKIASEIGNWPTKRYGHEILGPIYERSGLYQEALAEHKKFKAANDTIFNSERQAVIAEMQEKYKSEDQKKEIELLQKDSKIQSQQRIFLIIGIILLILLIFLLYNRYRLKQRAHNLRAEAAESKAAMMQIEFDHKTKELNGARELQLSMLPSVTPAHPDIIVAAKMITATEVGGDYYDYYKAEDNSFTIAIGDATGHGARAGIMVTAIKGLFTHLASEDNILDILCKAAIAIKKMRLSKLFMAFAVMRIKGNELEYAGAGMPPAYIFRSGTGEIEELKLKGLPLGIAVGNEYMKYTTVLKKGDTVLLVSDGFPELFNPNNETLGYDKVPLLLKESGKKTPEEIINHFTTCASTWLDGKAQQDDMTFVCFAYQKNRADFKFNTKAVLD